MKVRTGCRDDVAAPVDSLGGAEVLTACLGHLLPLVGLAGFDTTGFASAHSKS